MPDPTLEITAADRHLTNIVDGETDKTLRFYFSGEGATDPDTGATLYRLEVPEVT